MKRILIITLSALLLLCGCDKEKAVIFFSSSPISQGFTPDKAETSFKVGQKINFVMYNPKPFKSNVLKLQILKLDSKVGVYNVSIVHAREIEIDPENPYVLNSFALHSEGHYWLRTFSKINLEKPIAEADFKVDSL